MKRFLLCSCAMLMLFSLLSPVSVAHASDHAISVSANSPFSPENDILSVIDIWNTLFDAGDLWINSDGFFCVTDNALTNTPSYNHFLTVIEHCNLSISKGIITATSEGSVELSQAALSDCTSTASELPTYHSYFPTNHNVSMPPIPPIYANSRTYSFIYPVIRDDGTPHTCSRQSINALSICEENYQFLVTHYHSMLVMQEANPSFNAWLSTASLWVNMVRPGGGWDYKVSSEYGPYNKPLCAYYNGAYHHFTSEYFGNLNYGYTGSYLFSLNTLHFGSSAVAGFDPADESDWPAIDEGYHLKKN